MASASLFLSTFCNGLCAPLQAFVDWLTTAPARQPATLPVSREAPMRPACMRRPLRPVRPLRVVRVKDGAHERSCAGRMVISGRLADVCAELERLAALEGAGR